MPMNAPPVSHVRGQVRIIEAIATTIIVLILAALLPIIFNSPTTTLRSQVQTNTEWYAYDVLLTAINNPQFTYYVQHNNWSAIRSLLNTIVGPQYDWYIAVVPYRKVVSIVSVMNYGNYVLIPLSIIPKVYYAPPLGMPIFMTSMSVSMLSLNVYTINSILGGKYSINITMPLSNVAFIQCKNLFSTNITQCIKSGNVRMINWWLESFDPRTGVAVVWLNATGNVYMLVSNGSIPYNVLSNSYCQYPYCYPIGGVSNIMYSSFNAPYNNEPQFINYYTQQALSQCYSSSNGMYGGSNYLVMIKTSGGTASGQSLNAPTTVSCTLPVSVNDNVGGINAYLIGQLLTSIPGTSFTLGFSNVEVELGVCFVNGTCINDYTGSVAGASFPISIGNVNAAETYGNTHEYLSLSVNGNTDITSLPSYYYVYLLTLSLSLDLAKCGIDVNASIYDLVTMSSVSLSYFYNLTSNDGLNCTQLMSLPNITSISLTMIPSNILLQQSTPQNPNNDVYYVYNATTIVYDLWVSPTPTTSYYIPITISYNFESIDKYNVVPQQYRERFFLSGFAPTASAYAIIQLPNGTYYLVYLGLMSVASG